MERVKKAGGSVDGAMRVSLSWHNYDDLDLHMFEPGAHGYHIHFRQKASALGGVLDVDMNAGCGTTRVPVENISYRNLPKTDGRYDVYVCNWARRESSNPTFEVEVEINGERTLLSGKNNEPHTITRDGYKLIPVCTIVKRGSSISVESDRKTANVASSTVFWSLNKDSFVPVKMLIPSPNHWGDNGVGNKHYFFLLRNCFRPEEDQPRGFYNEFLRPELFEHRVAMETLSSKLLVPTGIDQLSGIGISDTSTTQAVVRVQHKTGEIKTYQIKMR